MKSEPERPMTLGDAAAAGVWLIVWRWDCGHQVEPEPAEFVPTLHDRARDQCWSDARYRRADAERE
jgi:hypothetical protein